MVSFLAFPFASFIPTWSWHLEMPTTGREKKPQQNPALSNKQRRRKAVSLARQKLSDNDFLTQAKYHRDKTVTLSHPPAEAKWDSQFPPSQVVTRQLIIPIGVVSEKEAKQGVRASSLPPAMRPTLSAMLVETA